METKGPLITLSENSSKFKPITTAIKLNELDGDQHDEQLDDVSFLLSIFDNIVGPKIIHVWRYDVNCDNSLHPTPYLSDYFLKYIAVHTLNGELYQDKLMGQIKYRLYFIKEINCVVFSVFFDAATADMNNVGSSINLMAKSDLKNSNTLKNEKEYINGKSNANLGSSAENVATLNNCLSMIFPLDKKDSFFKTTLLNSNVFLNYFENVIMEFKVFAHVGPKIAKVSSAIGYLTKSIKNFGQIIRILNHNGIMKSKLFVNDDADSQNEIPIVETFFSDPYTITSTYSLVTDEFILKSVTSHLITNYYTIIVGKTSNLVNKMINTLAIFMPKEKIRLSCYAIQDYFMLSPNLILQGLVTENPEEFNSLLEADFLFKRDYPTSIINISNKTVCRTSTGHEFVQTKEQFINHKIKFLFNNLNLSQLKILHPANEYLNWISYSSNQPRLIKKMLQELELFESEFGIKKSFIDKILKDLNFLALNLIEYVNSKLLEASHKTEKTIKISSKKLTKILDISTDEDLNVVLAFAHNLKPDFFRNFIFTN